MAKPGLSMKPNEAVMKVLLPIVFSLCLFGVSASFADNAKQPGQYGGEITLTQAYSVDDAIAQYASLKDQEILLEGKVTKVCQMKGCWMAFKSQVGLVRVTFKDYGFFVSEGLVGKEVLAQGVMFEETMSVSEARHYAEDAGMPKEEIEKITEPVREFRFVAAAVKELS